jgi:hypothetical protein
MRRLERPNPRPLTLPKMLQACARRAAHIALFGAMSKHEALCVAAGLDEFTVTRERPLSAAERALADQVFGAALDAARVRMVGQEHWASAGAVLLGRGQQLVVRGDRIFVPRGKSGMAPPDFCTQGPAMTALLAHELTHVWQYQNGYMTGATYILSFNWRYDYALEPGLEFLDYGFEQQASIVEDYVRLSHGLRPRRARHPVKAASLRGLMPFGSGPAAGSLD